MADGEVSLMHRVIMQYGSTVCCNLCSVHMKPSASRYFRKRKPSWQQLELKVEGFLASLPCISPFQKVTSVFGCTNNPLYPISTDVQWCTITNAELSAERGLLLDEKWFKSANIWTVWGVWQEPPPFVRQIFAESSSVNTQLSDFPTPTELFQLISSWLGFTVCFQSGSTMHHLFIAILL